MDRFMKNLRFSFHLKDTPNLKFCASSVMGFSNIHKVHKHFFGSGK